MTEEQVVEQSGGSLEPISTEATPDLDSQIDVTPAEVAVEEDKNTPKESHNQDNLPFIDYVIKKIPLVEFNEGYRITSCGLFVVSSKIENILEHYATWLKEKSGHDVKDEKRIRKLFGSDNPERFYLLEGKKCLTGSFISAQIQNPQNYRVAYYLGTPDSTRDHLHPSDPVFTDVEGLRAVQGRSGLEFVVEVKGQEVVVPLPGLKYFIKLARNSKKIEKHYPDAIDSLSGALKALVHILRKSRKVAPSAEPLRPLRLEKLGDKLLVVERSGFYFHIDKGRLTALYHVYGRNFYFYVREELALDLSRATRGRIGSFEIYKSKEKYLATLLINGVKHAVQADALMGFIKEILDNPTFIKQPQGVPAAKEMQGGKEMKGGKELQGGKGTQAAKNIRFYVEHFINTIQTAQPIALEKVKQYLGERYGRKYTVLVNDVWLFVISPKWIVVNTLSRTSKNRAG